ncbi:DUF3883 domain-containing protein [Ramlibacter lithotrophicus]|nr:DUF3883 domain-containing protein [Ramlibacter lithotrophicus]
MDWTRAEVEAIVADYLQMLALELSGQAYNKAAHRERLGALLKNRSNGSIEFKHCNISAALLALGFPYVAGYKPRSNYQSLLLEVLEQQLKSNPLVDHAALAAVQLPAVAPPMIDFSRVRDQAPQLQPRTGEPSAPMVFKAVKRDYLEREALNQSLGLAGEKFVVEYEHWRLVKLGHQKLADSVQHISQSRGDGLGFDILSYEQDGRERFIEVKTTSFGRETPFFVSRGELALSKQAEDQFHLYRLFEFRKAPRLFELSGPLERHCLLDPITYRATFS